MAHIKNYDIMLSAVVSVMVGFVVMLSDLFTRVAFWGGIRDNDDDDKQHQDAARKCELFLFLVI